MELLDCLDEQLLCCTVLCACPLDVGTFCVFCALLRLPNVGQGYNKHYLFVIVILCVPFAQLPVPLCGKNYTVLPCVL